MNQKSWDLKQTKQTTNHICCNCQHPIIHHSNYQDYRFCEECKIYITNDYNDRTKDPEEREHFNRYRDSDDFLDSVYEELSPKRYGIDERMES